MAWADGRPAGADLGDLVVPFDLVGMADRDRVGGKCASLGELRGAGVAVPDGFAATVEAFELFRRAGDLDARLEPILATLDVDDPEAVARASAEATALVLDTPVPAEVERSVGGAYDALCRDHAALLGTEPTEVPVAVRSSAVAEDGDTASFAGQQETYLWVRGAGEVVTHLRRCWASLNTPQALVYRARLPADRAREAGLLAVGVQVMVDAEVAGVLFTASPRTGDRSVMAINASWGLGQAVVAGEVTPDEYWIDRVSRRVVRRTVSDKAITYRPDPGGRGVVAVATAADRRSVPCLDAGTIDALVELGARIERHYGAPQDIEWALERSTDGTGHLLALQARPETVVTRRAAPSAPAAPTGGYLGIISALARSVGDSGGDDR